MKKKWNCNWPSIYKNPKKHDELIKYEDPNNKVFNNIKKLADFKDKVVLDAGAGTGKYSIMFSKLVKKIYALEIEQAQVDYLKKRLKKIEVKNVIPRAGNTEKMPFPNHFFDIVVSVHVFGGRNKRKMLDEVLRVLKPKGKFILVDAYYQSEFIDIWEKYSDKGIIKIFRKNYRDALKMYPFKTKVINNSWEFPSVKKAADLLGYVLSGKVKDYILSRKKKKVCMKDYLLYGVKNG